MTSNERGAGDPVERLPLEGYRASWTSIDRGDAESLSIGFENEGWTAQGIVSGISVHYVIRLSALWRVQQMLLFRDLDEPDLWLANDGSGRWGEVNGAQRRELGGCEDIDVACSAFTRTLAIRRLNLEIGDCARVRSIVVDPDTLSITRSELVYTRLDGRRWSIDRDDAKPSHRFDVDEYGLPLDIPGHFTRSG